MIDIEPLSAPTMENSIWVDQNLEIEENVIADTITKIADSREALLKENPPADIKTDDNSHFDLAAEIKEHPDSLYVKCFAIKADETNDNGDFFGKDELRKATPSFVGVPVFTNHQNTDVEKSRGKVVHSWWDDERNGIMIIARVDSTAYPQLARGIKEKYILGTSMGCQVAHSLCSICHNHAETPDQYCFEENTPILMSDFTTKKISDIQVGDMVIDAYGKPTKVTHLFKRHVQEKALILKSRAISGELLCTKNHPFLVYNRGEYSFCPAEYLHDKQELFTPIPQHEQDNSFFNRFGFDHLSCDNKKKLVRLLGYYGAEGSRIIR